MGKCKRPYGPSRPVDFIHYPLNSKNRDFDITRYFITSNVISENLAANLCGKVTDIKIRA